MRKILRAFLWASALVVVTGAFVLMLALSIPPEPDPVEYIPPSELQKRSQSVRRALEQLSITENGKNQPGVPIRLVLSEDDINAFLATDEGALRRMREKNILRARVKLQRNQVLVSSLVDFKGRTIKVVASGTLSATKEFCQTNNGGLNGETSRQKSKLVFEPTLLRIGRMAVPAFALADVLESKLGGREIVYSVPGEVEEIRVEDRRLILLLRPKRTSTPAQSGSFAETHKN
jgi:hypothetical protein